MAEETAVETVSMPRFEFTSTKTALALILPIHLQRPVNEIRRVHDRAYRKWQPHINILYPFVHPLKLSSALTLIRQRLHEEQIGSLTIIVDDVGVFGQKRGATMHLKPSKETTESLQRLKRILTSALGCDENEGTHGGEFRPHMTCGQTGQKGPVRERLIEEIREVAGFQWEANALAVLEREPSGAMKITGELRLGDLEGKDSERNDMKPIAPLDSRNLE